jgi:hypothetical protein
LSSEVGSISLTVLPAVGWQVPAAGNRSPKVTAKALIVGFHRMAHLVRPVPAGARDREIGYRHLTVMPLLVRKVAAGPDRTGRRAFRLSMAFAEQITLRISMS